MSPKWLLILAVPVLLALAACGGGAEEAQPTPSPSPAAGLPSSTPEPTLTPTPGPRVSPPPGTPAEGSILFLGGESGRLDEPPGVYLVDADGVRRVGDRLYYGHLTLRGDIGGRTLIPGSWRPAWSPDGTKVAFWACPQSPGSPGEPPLQSELYVMNSDGTGLTNVSSHPASDIVLCGTDAPFGGFDWSPDSSRLVFWSGRDPAGLYIVDIEGSGISYLAEGALPSWSPSGDSIVFSATQFSVFEPEWEVPIYTIKPDGSDRGLLTRVPCSFSVLHGCSVPWPQWSPDGTMLAFTATLERPETYEDSDHDVFIMNADGTGLVLISGLPENDPPGDGSFFVGWVNCQLPQPTAGCELKVTNVQPQRLNLREDPGTDRQVTGKLSEGESVCLLGSPGLADGFQWWPLHTAEGTEGWAAAFDPDEPDKPWLTATGRTCQGEG